MVKNIFFTIITCDYFKYALTLKNSLTKNKNEDFSFFCLIFNSNKMDINDFKKKCTIKEDIKITYNTKNLLNENYIGEDISININCNENNHIMKIYKLYDINIIFYDEYGNKYFKNILNKYNNIDILRWSSKPVFALDLLNIGTKIIYIDNDLYFHNHYDFLLNELKDNRFILTPHNREETQLRYDDHYPILIWRDGFFNAGFFGTNKKGSIILLWWIKMLLFRCDNDNKFFHDDQKYLDYIPVKFDNVKIIRHIGCNVSEWNFTCHKRIIKDNILYLQYANKDIVPVIFCHYTKWFIKMIDEGKDELFKNYLNEYERDIKIFENKNF
tara:strand:+ start:2386 stop:3369 length:984 start_codon:yes stop_codon:yes gene_type:complete